MIPRRGRWGRNRVARGCGKLENACFGTPASGHDTSRRARRHVDEERAELRLGEPGRGFGDRFDQLVAVQLAGERGAHPRERSTDVDLLPKDGLGPFSIGDVGDADQHAVEEFVRRGKRHMDDDIEPASVQGLHARFRVEVPLAA